VRQTSAELVALATSASNIQIIRHITRPIYGLQFHPEVRYGNNDGRRIFEAIMAEIIARSALTSSTESTPPVKR
jgi:GMP synthase-like glutamine amidotransferase